MNEIKKISDKLSYNAWCLVGNSNPKDLEKAVFMMDQAAKLGNNYANFYMFWFYTTSIGVKKDYKKASEYLKNSHVINYHEFLENPTFNDKSYEHLDKDMSNTTRMDIDQDKIIYEANHLELSEKDIQIVADNLFAKGISLLGNYNPVDLKDANFYILQSALLGNKSANYVMGNIFLQAIGNEQNIGNALYFFSRSELNDEVQNIMENIQNNTYKQIDQIDYSNTISFGFSPKEKIKDKNNKEVLKTEKLPPKEVVLNPYQEDINKKYELEIENLKIEKYKLEQEVNQLNKIIAQYEKNSNYSKGNGKKK